MLEASSLTQLAKIEAAHRQAGIGQSQRVPKVARYATAVNREPIDFLATALTSKPSVEIGSRWDVNCRPEKFPDHWGGSA